MNKYFLKNRRESLGLSQGELAAKIGVNVSTISRWESGDIENMKRDKIVKLAQALNISPAVIMGWDDLQEPSSINELEKKVICALREIDPETREAFCDRIFKYHELFSQLEKFKNETLNKE